MPPKPHVSAAIRQLRSWVTIAATLVVLAGLTQALTFGFVHFTDVRTAAIEPAPPTDLTVIGGTAPLQGPGKAMEIPDGNVRAAVGGIRTSAAATSAAVDVNTARTGWDLVLHRASVLACGIGGFAAIALMLMCMMGVAVAGGGAVPGVERVVTAAVWSIILAGLAVPVGDFMPSLPALGVFVGYESMTASSTLWSSTGAGAAGTLAQWVVAPLVAAAAAALVALWFRTGVARGIIITSVSELDEMAEREMAQIRKRGVSTAIGKSVGALNRTLGEAELPAQPHPAEDAVDEATEIAASLARDSGGPRLNAAGKLVGGRSTVDSGFKRLI
ncbi:MAG: hypothetical protein KF699_13225 [Phycisphaeraceae bacterium]|nr:hypothetical protein [Phycisphaeraceae bacterium]